MWREGIDNGDRGEKEWGGEWSQGVVRVIAECLRGPSRNWAAGQGRKGCVRQWERFSQSEAERETARESG